MFSLKTKIISTLGAFVILIVGISAVLFTNEKKHDALNITFRNTLSYVDFTAKDIGENYETFWTEKAYVEFNRRLLTFFEKNPNIDSVQIFDYRGTLLYDSKTEVKEPYEGPRRVIERKDVLEQIRAKQTSIMTDQRRILYIQNTPEGIKFTDFNGQSTEGLRKNERILHFAKNVLNRYSIVYTLSYSELENQIKAIYLRMILLALFTLMLGVLFAGYLTDKLNDPIQKLTEGAIQFSKGDLLHRIQIKTGDELEMLGNTFNQMATDITKNIKDKIFRERVSKELELAGRIQKDILPKEIPKRKDLDIAAGLIPAEEVGGDLYDFINLSNNRFVCYVGDVTGHGVPAGLIASVANALIYLTSFNGDIHNSLVATNSVLKRKMAANMFMTAEILEWDPKKQTVQFVNAGHMPMLHYHAKDKSVTTNQHSGVALGMISDITDKLLVEEIPFEIGDTIILYTDGVTEAWRNETENYGFKKLKETFKSYAALSSSLAIRNGLLADVKEFTGDYKQNDDITLIVIKRKA